jgi:hypothetical protein
MTTIENATVVSYAATRAQRSAAWKALRAKASRGWEAQADLATGNHDGRRLIVCMLVV